MRRRSRVPTHNLAILPTREGPPGASNNVVTGETAAPRPGEERELEGSGSLCFSCFWSLFSDVGQNAVAPRRGLGSNYPALRSQTHLQRAPPLFSALDMLVAIINLDATQYSKNDTDSWIIHNGSRSAHVMDSSLLGAATVTSNGRFRLVIIRPMYGRSVADYHPRRIRRA